MGDFTTAGEVESVTAHEVINNMENLYALNHMENGGKRYERKYG